MKPLTENIWNLLTQQYKDIGKNDASFVFEKERYEEFHKAFKDKYYALKDKYMLPDVDDLDRHKVAAIIVVVILEQEIIKYKNLDKNNIFIGAELLAIKVALSYMLDKLNEELKQKGYAISRVIFPEALSCDTPYIEIMCRNLFYAKRDYVLNPMDLSEKFFLLEQFWLLSAKIDPKILKVTENC